MSMVETRIWGKSLPYYIDMFAAPFSLECLLRLLSRLNDIFCLIYSFSTYARNTGGHLGGKLPLTSAISFTVLRKGPVCSMMAVVAFSRLIARTTLAPISSEAARSRRQISVRDVHERLREMMSARFLLDCVGCTIFGRY